MTAETKPRRKKRKIAASILLAILVLLAGGFFWYVSDYYRAEDVALEVLASGDHLEVRDDLTILSPSYPHGHRNHLLPRGQGGGYRLSASAGPASADRPHLHSGGDALPLSYL